MSRALWIFAVILNLWVAYGIAHTFSIYQGLGDLFTLVLSLVDAAIVIAFDIFLLRRVVKLQKQASWR